MAPRSSILPGFSLISILAALACSNQGEGERCDFRSGTQAGSNDCADNLICVRADELAENSGADRCCPPADQMVATSNARCQRKAAGNVTPNGAAGGGGGATAGEGGETSTGGTSSSEGGAGAVGGSGAATANGSGLLCTFDSQCLAMNEICGPTGRCQWQCLGDKDCAEPTRCDTTLHVCVPVPTSGGGGAAADSTGG